jgi:hypothetical protein
MASAFGRGANLDGSAKAPYSEIELDWCGLLDVRYTRELWLNHHTRMKSHG